MSEAATPTAQMAAGPLRAQFAWEIAAHERAASRALAEALDIPPLLAHLLILRGIAEAEQARHFLAPMLRHLHDPRLLTDMEAAAARIGAARGAGEHVRVFGDYDVDGIAATALLLRGLRRFGIARTSYGMPNRFAEGYGLAPEHVEAAHADGVSLLITVDNGCSAHAAAERARALGMTLIVTDHHRIEDGLPHAHAVINPRREAADHPLADLCGAGVAFKLSQALNGTPNDLDIAALGTVADLVPLRGENRTIVSLGLRHMAHHSRAGLAELAATAGVDLRGVTAENIAFQLGPRLNAAGRMDHGLPALELLLAEDAGAARAIALELDRANTDRRAVERRIFDEAAAEVDAAFTPSQRSVVVARRGWHQGVAGIVAARIEGRYRRPSVVIAIDENGLGRGSGRAGGGFDLVGAIGAARACLVRYGGHRAAAGITIEAPQIDAFRAAFETAARAQLGDSEPVRTLRIDAHAAFSQIDGQLVRALERLEPAGCDNPAPVFCTCGAEVLPGSVRRLKEQHLKLVVRHGGVALPAIGFNMAARCSEESLRAPIDLAYTPQLNTYRGETSVQLVLKDLRPA